jgi:hypothetical protein
MNGLSGLLEYGQFLEQRRQGRTKIAFPWIRKFYTMGSSKSKPIAESARSVLNKRQAQAPSPESLAQGIHFNVKNISVWYKPEILQREITPAQQAAKTESTDLNPTLLREISKWDIVRSTTKDTQVRVHNVLVSFFTMPMMFYSFIANHQFRFSTNLRY